MVRLLAGLTTFPFTNKRFYILETYGDKTDTNPRYSKNRGDNPMKRLSILALILMLMLTGCQPTPETPVVVGKNEGDNKITSLFGETSATEGPYTAPESWKEESPITSADLSVMIDANVTVPDVTKFPVVKVTDHVFTQEEADNILAVLSDGNALFRNPALMNREDKVLLLLEMKARLAELKAIPNPSEAELYWITQYEDTKIPLLEAEINAMPKGATPVPFTTNFQPDSLTGAPYIVAATDLGGGNIAIISITNGLNETSGDVTTSSSYVTFGTAQNNMYWTVDDDKREITKENAIPNGTSITREKAIAQAEDMMRKAGIRDMRLVLTMPASATIGSTLDGSKQCWVLGYYPVVNGILLAAIKNNAYPNALWASYPDDDAETEYNAVFYSPAVFFQIDDTGIYMQWAAPIDLLETLNENAVLLPFEQIQERIRQQLPITYAAMESVTEVHITRVELNYMRARIKDTQDGYMLIPVWDVIGYTDEPIKNPFDGTTGARVNPEDFLETLLTISAIDGSVLDRQLGY
jgi:hypothetical protein